MAYTIEEEQELNQLKEWWKETMAKALLPLLFLV